MHFLLILIFVSANDNQIEASSSGRKFDILDKRDVMVFLHIQKTGGTNFNRNLIRNIEGHKCEEGKVSKKRQMNLMKSRARRPRTKYYGYNALYHSDSDCGTIP